MKDKLQPLVTIVSAFYNRGYCARESVQSLIDQTYENIEIILVDDESKDNTLDVLKEFESEYEHVKVISHENRGLTRSFKEALALAKGEFIAIHGSGDISFPERIERQVDYLLSNPSIGVVGCGREIYCEITKNSTYIENDVVFKKGKYLGLGKNFFSHGEVLMRADLYRKAGGYRGVFKYTQDYDLWLRINELADLSVFSEILYREYSRTDGVRNNTDKVIDQIKFFTLAKLSAISRKKVNGNDILNSQYDDPFELLISSHYLSNILALKAFLELSSGNRAVAYKFITESKKYPSSFKVFMVDLSIRFELIGKILIPIGKIIKKRKIVGLGKRVISL